MTILCLIAWSQIRGREWDGYYVVMLAGSVCLDLIVISSLIARV